MATRDEHQRSKESVFLDDAGGTPLLYRPETPALTPEAILERSRGRCEPARLPLLDTVRKATNAGAGRLSATGRAIHERATNLGLRVRAATRPALRMPASYQPAPLMTAGAATLVLLVEAVVLAPRPHRTSVESQSPRFAALPAPAAIPAPTPGPAKVGTAGKRSTVGPRSGAVDGRVAAAPMKALSVHTSDSPRRAVSPGLVGTLLVDSKPSGAEVWINGVPHGRTPLKVSALPVGSRVIRLELPGYERWSWAVNVVANQRTPLRVKLQPERRRMTPGS
jgi:hypothetical protein